jgi:hypothetical protein
MPRDSAARLVSVAKRNIPRSSSRFCELSLATFRYFLLDIYVWDSTHNRLNHHFPMSPAGLRTIRPELGPPFSARSACAPDRASARAAKLVCWVSNPSWVLCGRAKGRRFSVYVSEELVPEVRRCLDNGRALQEMLYEAAPRYVKALKRAKDKRQKRTVNGDMSRAVSRQRTFDDLALTRQGVVLEPLLQAISDFLDDHQGLITTIQGDLRRGLKNPDTGRAGAHGATDLALAGSHARQELGLSRTDCRWHHAGTVRRFLLPAGAQARSVPTRFCPTDGADDQLRQCWSRRPVPLDWKTRMSYASTPRLLGRIFIIPTTHCCGMSSVSSRAWSAGSQTRLDGLSRSYAGERRPGLIR